VLGNLENPFVKLTVATNIDFQRVVARAEGPDFETDELARTFN